MAQDDTQKLQEMVQIYYVPEDMKNRLNHNLLEVEQDIIHKLAKIFKQNVIEIHKIIVRIEENTHQGAYTYACKISYESPDIDWIHSEEGHDFLAVTRQAVNSSIEAVFAKKEEIVENRSGQH